MIVGHILNLLVGKQRYRSTHGMEHSNHHILSSGVLTECNAIHFFNYILS